MFSSFLCPSQLIRPVLYDRTAGLFSTTTSGRHGEIFHVFVLIGDSAVTGCLAGSLADRLAGAVQAACRPLLLPVGGVGAVIARMYTSIVHTHGPLLFSPSSSSSSDAAAAAALGGLAEISYLCS